MQKHTRFLLTAGAAFLCSFLIVRFVIFNGYIPSESMLPKYQVGDRIVCNRLAYLLSDPDRYDVVVFHAPDSGETYIKRIMGLPGETIHIKNGKIYINGNEIADPNANESWGQGEDMTFRIPEDSYFMMGDNRNHSYDARYWNNHFVKKEDIIAKAGFRYYPIKNMGFLY